MCIGKDTMTLEVNSMPKFTKDDPSLVVRNVTFGDSLNLDCSADFGSKREPSSISWYFKEHDSDRLKKQSSDVAELSIDKIESTGGVYKCIVSNNYGNISRTFDVFVLAKGESLLLQISQLHLQ
jgi:Immunoglobulin domain